MCPYRSPDIHSIRPSVLSSRWQSTFLPGPPHGPEEPRALVRYSSISTARMQSASSTVSRTFFFSSVPPLSTSPDLLALPSKSYSPPPSASSSALRSRNSSPTPPLRPKRHSSPPPPPTNTIALRLPTIRPPLSATGARRTVCASQRSSSSTWRCASSSTRRPSRAPSRGS